MTSITAQLPEKFEAAADHIQAVGLHRGACFDAEQYEAGTPADQCRVCAMGAVSFAIHGHPDPAEMSEDEYAAYLTAGNLAYAHLGGSLAHYNDVKARAAEEVAEILRTVAARARAGDLPFSPHEH